MVNLMGVILWSRESYEDLSKSEISVVFYRQNGWVMVVTVSLGGMMMLERNEAMVEEGYQHREGAGTSSSCSSFFLVIAVF